MFHDAVLEDANLSGCDLRGATLNGANLRGANLRGAKLCLDGLGGRTDFLKCDLSGADLRDADIGGADFTGALMIGADLRDTDLRGARLRRVIERHAPAGLEVHFSYNAEWHLENGVSVLTARERLRGSRFALLMGDHLFHAPMLTRLLREPIEAGESALAIDSRRAPPAVAEEATKVRLNGSRIVAIGKDLVVYDALDTGVFVCAPPLFDALVESREADDTTLSGGIRRLAARGLMRGVDVGDVA